MPFSKGISGNPNGRPKGSTNNNIKDLRERIKLLLDAQFEQIITDLKDLEPRERINAYIKLIEYVVPKLKSTEYKEQGTSLEALISLNTDERRKRISELKQKVHG